MKPRTCSQLSLLPTGCTAVTILAVLTLLLGCQDMGVAPVGIVVPGLGVDGVRLGDSRETVERVLGKPSGGGIADGVYRAWGVANYREGPEERLDICYIETANGYGLGDMIGAGTAYNKRKQSFI